MPEGNRLRRLTYAQVPIQAGGRARVLFTVGGNNSYQLALDSDGDGAADQQIAPTVSELVADLGPQPVGAVQLYSPGKNMTKYGQLMAVVFNEEIARASSQDGFLGEQITNYQVEANQVRGVALQPGGRVVYLLLRDGVGPFIPRTITVSGVTDRLGHPMQPASVTLPIRPTITWPGGVISGTVRHADGTPVPFAPLQFSQIELDANDEAYLELVSVKNADSEGRYAFDYVKALPTVFEYMDPESGQQGRLGTAIRHNGQQLGLDLILLGTGTLAGQVLAADGVTPLAGARIRVTNPVRSEEAYGAVSDASGAFVFGKLPVGTLSIHAVHEPSKSQALAVATIPQAGATVAQDLILVPVAQTDTVGVLAGQVFRADGSTPAPGIPVYTTKGGVATTAADGSYRIEGLPAGPIGVRAIDQIALEQATVQTTIVADETVIANLLLAGGAGTINGVVLEADGTPVPGIKVYGGPLQVQSAADGTFTLTDVPVGEVGLTAQDEVKQRLGSAHVNVTYDGETVSARIVLPATATLTGRIFRTQGGQPVPVPNLKIFALGPRNDKTFTAADGSYRFENLPLGEYTISAFYPDFSDGNIGRGKLVFRDETLQLNVTFKGRGKVTGIVYDDDGVTPLGARVGLSELQVKVGRLVPLENPDCKGSIEVGGVTIALPPCENVGVDFEMIPRKRRLNSDVASGTFAFDNVFVGDFTVEAANPFSPEAVAVTGNVPAPGASVAVTLSLQATGVVSGTVYPPDGVTPVGAGVIVRLDNAFLSDVRVQTDADGRYLFPLVNPGQSTVTAIDNENGLSGQSRAAVNVGETAIVPVRLLRMGEVKVTVLGSGGVPVVGAAVTLEQGAYPHAKRTGVTQAGGVLNFAGGDAVSEGAFSVFAQHDGINGYTGGAVPGLPAPGQVAVTVTLNNAAGTVAGRFLRSDGVTPIPNAQIALSANAREAYVTTDAGGNFLFPGVLAGSFSLDALDPVSGRRGRATGSVTENMTTTVTLLPVPQGTVAGLVRLSSDGSPVAGAGVVLKGSGPLAVDLRATTGPNGFYSLPGVSAGPFTVDVIDPTEKFSGRTTGTLTSEGQTVTADVTIQVPPTGRVEGYVFRADGTPAHDAQVTLTGNDFGITTTNNDGFYSFSNVRLGAVVVTAKAAVGPDGGAASGELLSAGGVARVDVHFVGTGRVAGTVTTGAGVPVAGLQVFLARNPTTPPLFNANTLTDNAGHFEFATVPVGEVSLFTTQSSTGLAGSGSGTLSAPGATLDVPITLAAAGTVSGQVVREDGVTPAPLMAVELVSGPLQRFGSTDSNGNFTLADVKLATYELTITDPLGEGIVKATAVLTSQGQVVNFARLVLDTAPPAISAVIPANGAGNIPVTQTIQVRFSEPVQAGTVNGTNLVVSNSSGLLSGSWTLSADSTLATFTPAATFRDFDRITVRVKTGIVDLVGRPLQQETVSSFTTSDSTAPRIDSRSPVSGAQAVPLNAVIRIQFNEAIDLTKFTSVAEAITLSLDDTPVPGRVDPNSTKTVLVFTPNTPLLSNSAYRVTVQPATDLAGNRQTSGDTFTFTTVDLVAPVIQSLASSAGTTVRVGTSTALVATLEPASDVAQVEFFVNGQSRAIDTSEPYAYPLAVGNTPGPLAVSAQAADRSGNLSAIKTLTLTVAPDLAPQVTILSPDSDAVVPGGSPLVVTVNAQDDYGVARVFFQSTGVVTTTATTDAPAGATSFTATFTVTIPANATPGGALRLQASATDNGGRASATEVVTVMIEDTVAPDVQFVAPPAGALVNPGSVIDIVLSASDSGQVAEVTLQASGAASLTATYVITPPRTAVSLTIPLTMPVTAPPHSQVQLVAQARDRTGNLSAPVTHTLTVRDSDGPTVHLALPDGVQAVAGGDSLRVTVVATDATGVKEIGVGVTGAFSTTQNRTLTSAQAVATAEFTVTVPITVTTGSTVTLTGTAVDDAGNLALSPVVTLPVTSDPPPQVTILAPAAGVTVSTGSAVTVTLHAEDETGLTRIELATSGAITEVQTVDVPADTTSYTATFQVEAPATAAPGELTLHASALDTRLQRSAVVTRTLTIVDATPPSVQISSPAGGASIVPGGLFTVSVEAADNGGVALLDLTASGGFETQLQQTIAPPRTGLTAHFTVTVPPTVTANTPVTVTVLAYDAAGNPSAPAQVTLTTQDVTPPTVSLALPDGSQGVAPGESIRVTVTATDAVGVQQIGVSVSGAFSANQERTLTPAQPVATAEFTVTVPITVTAGSIVTLTGTASDGAGNLGLSPELALPVTLDEPPQVTIVSPANGFTVNTGSAVTVVVHAVDATGLSRIELATTGVVTASHAVTLPTATTSYTATFEVAVPANAAPGLLTLHASARDTIQQQANAAPVELVVADATPPTAQITSPAPDSGVAPGAVLTVTVHAADNGGVALLDLTASGGFTTHVQQVVTPARTDLVAQLAVTVPATVTATTPITLTVHAEDGAGNVSLPAQVTVHTSDVTPPVVTVALPAGMSSVSQGQAITVTVTATDDVGVTQLGFETGGALVLSDTLAVDPAQTNASTVFVLQVPATVPVGSGFTVTGTAHDAAGNLGASTSVSLTVTAPMATLSGLVTDGDNQPVAGAAITVMAANGVFTATAGADGRYQVGGIAEGVVTVHAVHPANGLRGSATSTVAAGAQNVTIDVQIPHAPLVAITDPVTGTAVFERAAVAITATASSAAGVRHVEFLVDGAVVFTDTTAPYRHDLAAPVGVASLTLGARAVDSEGNSSTTADVVIRVVPDTATIVVGRVVDANNLAVAGAMVTTVDHLTATSGADGSFTIAGVPTVFGSIEVTATATVDGKFMLGKSAPVAPVLGGVTDVGVIELRVQKYWDGPVTGSWQTAANWNDNTLPGPADHVYIPVTATVTFDAGSASIHSLTSDGALKVTNGTLSIAAASAIHNGLTVSGGALTGSDSITTTGMLTWTGGTLSGSGQTVAAGGLLINGSVTLDGRTLENGGAATWTGGHIALNNGAVLHNRVGASFTAQNIGYNINASSGALGHFINAGSLVKEGASTNTIFARVTNSGDVRITAGTLGLNGGGTNSGLLEVASGATLSLSTAPFALTSSGTLRGAGQMSFGSLSSGSFVVEGVYDIGGGTSVSGATTFPPGVTLQNLGSLLNVSNGTLTLNSGEPVSLPALRLSGGALTGSDSITTTGMLTWTGGTLSGSGQTVAAGGLLINGSVTLDGRTLENGGAATWTGGHIALNNGAVLHNRVGASFTAQNIGYNINASSGALGHFINAGSLVKEGASTNTIFARVTNSGDVRITAGTLGLNGGYTQTGGSTVLNGGALSSNSALRIQGGKLTGIGTVAAGVINGGVVEPGNGVGSLTISGNYEQTGSGSLRVQIGGLTPETEFDRLTVTGAATLTGTLAISLTNGFTPTVGDSFIVMTFASRNGDFTQVNGADLGNEMQFVKNSESANVTLAVITTGATAAHIDADLSSLEFTTAITPEPQIVVTEVAPSPATTAEYFSYLPIVTSGSTQTAESSGEEPAAREGNRSAQLLYLPVVTR
ncbi:MAG: carboxypeptidase regulatory-like domain-containing protein [Caldilineaceae bacterium]|nr:carboxypeptidase regulatory-like domain-containing protein [Caldilineaceae bacterium]